MKPITHILITAPDGIRVKYTALRGKTQVDAISRLRPTGDGPRVALLAALKSLARPGPGPDRSTRHPQHCPGRCRRRAQPNGLRAAFGLGPDTPAQLLITVGGNPYRLRTEASFTALCGVAPVPASSGRTNRHRLSRGGGRGANSALCRIAPVRMSSDARTRECVAGRTAAGRTKKEIIRLLKRAIAREIFRYLTTPVAIPDIADLRPARQAKNITLTTVAEHFGVGPTVISCIERGTRRDDDLADASSTCSPPLNLDRPTTPRP
ncbi:transposase [Streptomyces sp. BE147]|uniref:transposase n=1 Tax=Streptomyces sp. BE147 TaxID=3002524 RepID=UPI002E798AA4|nr:transposase [Streptomyces sp. BE147]MEE1736136.1 transposase [Streptomyces sp. BE147]